MSMELVGILVSLATLLLTIGGGGWAVVRSIRSEISELGKELKSNDRELRQAVGDLRFEMQTGDENLRAAMQAGDDQLRTTMADFHAETKAELRSLNTRLDTINTRLDATNTRIDRLSDRLATHPEPAYMEPAGA